MVENKREASKGTSEPREREEKELRKGQVAKDPMGLESEEEPMSMESDESEKE